MSSWSVQARRWIALIVLMLAAMMTVQVRAEQIVILKLDDMRLRGGALPVGWDKVFKVLEQEDVSASIGIICNSLEDAPDFYIQRLKDLHDSGRYEFWNHGWSHWRSADKKTCEFRGTGYEQQREHIFQGQDIAHDKLGFELHGFGAPFNAVDADTAKVIGERPEMTWWMYVPDDVTPPQGVTPLPRPASGLHLEKSDHTPDIETFLADYPQSADEPVLVLQGHPPYWSEDSSVDDFHTIVRFLKDKGCRFVLPSQYLRLLAEAKEKAPPDGGASDSVQ